MPKIVFIEPDGRRREVHATPGISLMETARVHGIAGILALCGGACACATCHLYVGEAGMASLPPPEDMEQGMLESVALPRGDSRLGCQVLVTATMDGLEVTIPADQSPG
jgi:2Fe-2S ferredoxin